jgi:hypothetical protein
MFPYRSTGRFPAKIGGAGKNYSTKQQVRRFFGASLNNKTLKLG